MKTILTSLVIFFAISASAQSKVSTPDPKKKIQVVEASCGQCKFGMSEKKGCDLAVRINGKAYFVKGTGINDHGDAHADDGFCESIRKAEVQGEIVDNKFVATYFKLLPDPKKTD